MLLPLCLGLARAQGFDARGPVAPPATEEPGDAPWTVGAATTGAVALRLSYTDRPLVRTSPDGAVAAVVDDLVGAELTALSPALGPLRVGVVAPILYALGGEAAGVAAGDLTLWAPVVGEAGPVALGVIPLLRVPTGARAAFLGDPAVAPGGLASVRLRAGRLVAAAEGGAELAARTGIEEWPGGPTALATGAVGVVPVEDLGLHAMVRTRAGLAALASVPSEVALAARWRAGEAFASVSASRALTRGVGAPGARIEATVGWAPAPRAEPVVEETPLVPLERLRVTTTGGAAVRGAAVAFGGETAETDAFGTVAVPAGAVVARLSKAGFVDAELPLGPGAAEHTVVLARPPVPVSVRVVDADGRAVATPVALDPPVALQPDAVGTWQGTLPPGTYRLTAGGEGLGAQQRTLEVTEGRTDPLVLDVVLHPAAGEGSLAVAVVDPSGRPVEDARLSLDDRPLGSTGSGGDLVVGGLAAVGATLTIDGDPWRDGRVEVVPGEGAVARVALDWPDGAARIRAVGPDGLVTDALVAFHGPTTLPPAPLGADGERLFTLRPGSWSVLVSSPALGAQERRFDLAPGGEVVTVELVLQPEERGDADLTVSVVGPEGAVPGAVVALDGAPLGATGPDGTLRVLALDRGARTLSVEAALMRPWSGPVDLFGGGQAVEVPVRWAAGALEVAVWDPAGQPIDAVLAGRSAEATLPAARLGPDGVERVQLGPGTWDLALSDPAWGTQIRTLTVRDADEGLRRVTVRMLPPDDDGGRLRLVVRDPEGVPVEGARVTVGGQALGTTTDGGLDARSLARTTSELLVEADALTPARRRVHITDDTSITVDLGWAVGATRVRVQGPDGPVSAVVAAAGASVVPPRRTRPDGTVLLGLAPGEWRVLASSAELGAAEVDAAVPSTAGLTTVPVTLAQPAEEAGAVLLVRVQDEDGRPVAGVPVRVGDREAATGPLGTAAFDGLSPGPVEVRIARGLGFDERTVGFALPAGAHERIVVVERTVRRVEVRAVGPDGSPVAASILAEGASTLEALAGAGEAAVLELPPGRWSLSARSTEGVGTEAVEVVGGPDVLAIVLSVAPTESRVEGARVVLGRAVPFDLARATLRPDALPILDDVARMLRAEAGLVRVEVAGHTDDRGGVAYNQELSERRAAAVRDALVARGIDPERLVARGYGLLRPLEPGADEAARARNRRVEIVVLERAP